MKYLDKLIFALLFFSILGFSYFTTETENTTDAKANLTKFEDDGIILKYIPVFSFKRLLDMKISWYGSEFHGRKTASGDTFNQESFTAAHKTFQFGTLLKLTNRLNNKSVVVRINDRGPFIRSRELDISYNAAKSLGLIKAGVQKLGVEMVVQTDSIEIMK